jgi:hypothetical protein
MSSSWQPSKEHLDFARSKTQELTSSTKSHWREIRGRLSEMGISADDCVVGAWQDEGLHFIDCLIGCRDDRLFEFDLQFDFDEGNNPLPKGIAWVTSWKERSSEDVRYGPTGFPNLPGQAVAITQLVLEVDRTQD